MSNEVKRYSVRGQFDHGLNLMTTREVVLASDYDALAAELAAIRAAGGEQVEVVAEVEIIDESEGSGGPLQHYCHLTQYVPDGAQLMTVAQHARIVAAMAAELEKARKGFPAMVEYVEEIAQLRAELEAARKQEPVMWAFRYNDGTWRDASHTEHSAGMLPLYAAPPLAGQVSVPDDLRGTCMLVAEVAIKHGRGRDRSVSSEECSELVDSVIGSRSPRGCDYAGCCDRAHPGTSLCLRHHSPKHREALLATPSMEVKS